MKRSRKEKKKEYSHWPPPARRVRLHIHTYICIYDLASPKCSIFVQLEGGWGWIEEGDDIDAIDLDLHEQKRILKKGKEKKIDGNNPQTAFIDSGLPFLFPFSFCPFFLPFLPHSLAPNEFQVTT